MVKVLREEEFSSSTKDKIDNTKSTVRYRRLSDGGLQYLQLSKVQFLEDWRKAF